MGGRKEQGMYKANQEVSYRTTSVGLGRVLSPVEKCVRFGTRSRSTEEYGFIQRAQNKLLNTRKTHSSIDERYGRTHVSKHAIE